MDSGIASRTAHSIILEMNDMEGYPLTECLTLNLRNMSLFCGERRQKNEKIKPFSFVFVFVFLLVVQN